MRYQRALLSLASAALCTWPLQVLAQTEGGFLLEEAEEKEPIVITTSSAELGMGWLSNDSYKFGEYSGLTDKGPFPIANIEFLWRAPYDGESTQYWEFSGTNLGLDTRSIHVEAGQQGRFSVFLDYSEIPHFAVDDALTPYIGAGGNNLTLPPGCTGGGGTTPPPDPCWDPSDNTPAASAVIPNPNMLQLDAALNPVKLKTERTRAGAGFTYDLSDGWSLGGSFSREKKDGLESIAGIFASSGGTPRAAILPKPIDYTTQDANVFVAYQGDRLQAQLGYHLSQFDENNSALTFQNAFDAVGGWDPDQSFGNGGFGRMALEPDNAAHSVTLAMGFTPNPTTRIAGNFSYTRMLQDEDFLPYSTTGFGADGIAFGALPRDSLEGDITKIHAALSVAKQITPDFGLSAQYTFDDRDNNTPTDIYCYVPNDSVDQDPACGAVPDDSTVSTRARINRPYSRREHDFKMDATYRVMPSTKVALGYAFENIERDLTEVANTYEHTGSVKVTSSPLSFASGWLKYSFADRSGSDYVSNEPVLVSHTGATIEDEGGAGAFFEANPFARKFYIADRQRNRLSGSLNLMATDELSFGLMGSIDRSDFHNTLIGLTERDFASATLDASYTPNEDIALYGFFTYDRMRNMQTGYERGGDPILPGDPLDPALFWDVDTRDQGFTAGVGTDWTVIQDKLKLGIDYTYSHTVTQYAFSAAPALGAEPVPDVTSNLHSVGARAEYTFAEGAIASLFYRFEVFDNNDFALNTGSSLPAVLTLGSQSLDYTEHLVGVSVRFQF